MYSKITLAAAAALIVGATAGCGIKLGEKNRVANVAEIKGASCLKQSVTDIKTFFKGDATEAQVSQSVECFQNVLLSFKDNVRGQDKNSYTPAEIGQFVSQNFLTDGTQFSPELLTQIMKLKVALFGGTEQVILKTEIQAISSFVARYKPELVNLNPHMKIIVSSWAADGVAGEEKEQKFKAAKTAFNSFLARVAQDFSIPGRSYEINDLVSLAVEGARFAKSDSSTVDTIDKARPFVIKFKTTLIGGETALKGAEWKSLAKTVSEVFFQALRIKYFYNGLTPEQVAEKWKVYDNVASDVTQLIPDLMAARNLDLLKNTDIIELVQAAQPLFPDLNINADLIQQVGKLKVALVGESAHGSSGWSRPDFLNLNAKVSPIFSNVAVVLQNKKYLKADKDKPVVISYEDFVKAEALVNGSVKAVSNLIIGSYDIGELRNLLVNLSQGLLKDTLILPDNFEAIIELAKSAKFALTGEPGSQLTSKNIYLLLNVGIRAYFHYLEYVNYVGRFQFEDKDFAYNLERLVKKAHQTLAFELSLKPTNTIYTNELTQLVLAVQQGKFLSTKLSETTLNKVFDALWSHILNTPENRLRKRVLTGFNPLALQQLAAELKLWLENQKIVVDVFSEKSEFKKAELIAKVTAKTTTDSSGELLRVLSANGLMNFNDVGYLKILTATNGDYHRKDLVNSNIARAIARLVIRSYAGDLERANNLTGITLEEAQFGYAQLKPLGVDLDVLDESNTTFISSRFRESNLFLAPSNGDEYSSFEEAHHLVLHIMSGLKRSASLKTLADAKCVKAPLVEAVAKTEYDEQCLLDLYFGESDSFAGMPDFLKARQSSNADDSKMYYLSLLKAAGHVQNDNKTVFLADAGLYPHAVQYVEMLFSTHDTNKDMLLQRDEALVAFAVFKKLITDLAKAFPILKEPDMPGVFIYLLKFGKPPTTFADKLKFAVFVKDHDCTDNKPCMKDWNIQTTRHDIGKIFNFIAEATKPQPPASATVTAR